MPVPEWAGGRYSMMRRLQLGLLALLLALLLPACSDKASGVADKKAKAALPAIPVVVAAVSETTVPLKVQAIGNVEVQATVAVKSRVDGQIVKMPFSDGQDVSMGQVLFEIDPRPFQALPLQAQAALARDKASLER